ncbi:MAG: ComEA family DNA-binding protein [Limnochordia bacterium]|jgi:competence protein ComEA
MQKREQILVALVIFSLTLGSGLWIRAAVWSAGEEVQFYMEEVQPIESLELTPGEGQFDPRININRANVELLCTLPGIGPVLAERIIAYREEQGEFKEPEELINVSGIGAKKLAGLLDLIRVE